MHEIFFNLQYKCTEVPISPISKWTASFSVSSSVNYHYDTLEFISRIYCPIFLWNPKCFFSPDNVLNFFPVCPTMAAKKFRIYGLKVTRKNICDSPTFLLSSLTQKEITDLRITFLTISLTIFNTKTFILTFFFLFQKTSSFSLTKQINFCGKSCGLAGKIT